MFAHGDLAGFVKTAEPLVALDAWPDVESWAYANMAESRALALGALGQFDRMEEAKPAQQ